MKLGFYPSMLAVWLAICTIFVSQTYGQFSADYQTNTISGIASNWVGEYFVGSNSVFNTLIIQSAGLLSNADGIIGYEDGSTNNVAIVSDPGSVWSNRANLYVSYGGSGNSLVISNGASTYSSFGYIGAYGESNTGIVCGPQSVWDNNNILYVGYQGSFNQLIITNGGVVNAGASYVGFDLATNNTVIVSGTGSVWNTQSELNVGRYGFQSKLVIADGAAVYDTTGNVGITVFSHSNAVVVSGSGSVWSNRDLLRVGACGCCGGGCGDGTLVITNGGAVVSSTFSLTSGMVTLAGGTLTVNQLLANSGVVFLRAAPFIPWARP